MYMDDIRPETYFLKQVQSPFRVKGEPVQVVLMVAVLVTVEPVAVKIIIVLYEVDLYLFSDSRVADIIFKPLDIEFRILDHLILGHDDDHFMFFRLQRQRQCSGDIR